MSQSDDGEDRPRREVAWRVFAAEFDDADYQYAESDEERAPNYVVTPTGARVNRLFAVGVLTTVEQVNDDVVRARIVDPTGAFVVYAGQYQPDALASLENADVPSFVAVTGKARTFSPEDSDRVFTSIRPESVNAVTPETRDRWVVTTAERTLARIGTFADALETDARGDDLVAALTERDVPYALASGISRAIDHYGTTPAYLAALREAALDATRVVAGDLDEVGEFALAPDEGDGTDADLHYGGELPEVDGEGATVSDADEADVSAARAEPSPDDGAAEAVPDVSPDDVSPDAAESRNGSSAGRDAERSGDDTESETEATEPEPSDVEAEAEPSGPEAGATAADGSDVSAARAEPSPDDEGAEAVSDASPDVDESRSDSSANRDAERPGDDFEPEPTDEPETESAETDAETETEPAGDADEEAWEMDEETRAEVEEEFDVGFSTGGDIPEGGEADLSPDDREAGVEDEPDSRPSPDDFDDAADDGELGDFESTGDFDADEPDEVADADDFTEEEYDEPESDAEDAESAPPDLDLEDAVVDYMDELDDGDGAEREDLVRTVMEETDADESAIEDAIQSALMGGRCYESGDDHLKAI